MMKTSKKIVLQIAISLMVLIIALVTISIADEARQTYSGENGAALRVTVCDLNGNALKNASVTIVELNKTVKTDESGKTQNINASTLLSNKNWTQVTVIVVCDGYIDTILFGCTVYAESPRTVVIRLYNQDQSGLEYVAYSETAPPEYIKSLLKKYK